MDQAKRPEGLSILPTIAKEESVRSMHKFEYHDAAMSSANPLADIASGVLCLGGKVRDSCFRRDDWSILRLCGCTL